MEICHPWHGHPLLLSDEVKCEDHCSFCRKRFDGNPFYACVDCKYYVHKSCALLPLKIEHHFHQPHPLELCNGREFACDSCHKTFKNELRFNCSACNFDLDVKCALMSEVDTEEKEFIRHFTHQHPLTICSKEGDNPLSCFACKKTSSDLIYGCISCDYFLHKSCFEISTHILHAMHPRHALSLVVNFGRCDYCRIYDYAWKYYCSFCKFNLDVSCLIESTKDAQNSERSCFLCGKQHLDSDSCVNSSYFINQSCIKLPEEIEHKYHSHKPLLLSGDKDFSCDSCHKGFQGQACYSCEECNFQMDVKCTLMPSIHYDESDEYTQPVIFHHFNHHHPLQLIKEVYDIDCVACQETTLSPIYGCITCEYFIHQSCRELPGQILHPLHNSHVLTIQSCRSSQRCQVCYIYHTGVFFVCIHCHFFIGIECVFEVRPIVAHKYHPHPLCLVEKSYINTCNVNNTFCQLSKESSEFELAKSCSLRCIKCDYHHHLLCGPLPCTIKHKSHLHVLSLVDSKVEDDSDEYYCDICEEIRNPRLCVYYCEDCKFISHVHCVISEIINALKKSPKNVEFRIVRDLKLEDNIDPRSCENFREETLLDLLKSLSADDVHKLNSNFPNAQLFVGVQNSWEAIEHKSSYEDDADDIIEEFSLYNDDIMSNVWKRLERFKPDTEYHIQCHEYVRLLVKVQGYKVSSNFVYILKALLRKNDNFCQVYEGWENVKSVLLYFLCRVLEDMSRTYIADTTEKQLFTWHYYISRLRRCGFQLNFVEPFLERITRSYYGLQAMKFENEAPGRLDAEIVNVEKKISELKTKREKLKAYRQQHWPGEIAEKSTVMRDICTEAKNLKWKIAGDGIFNVDSNIEARHMYSI